MNEEVVILRNRRDAGGLRYLDARRTSDGGVVIAGQDLGAGVEGFYGAGNTEYEWHRGIAPADAPAASAALGGAPGEDLLEVIARWAQGHLEMSPEADLAAAGVPMTFASRVGQ